MHGQYKLPLVFVWRPPFRQGAHRIARVSAYVCAIADRQAVGPCLLACVMVHRARTLDPCKHCHLGLFYIIFQGMTETVNYY
jgi:hypothetical protein